MVAPLAVVPLTKGDKRKDRLSDRISLGTRTEMTDGRTKNTTKNRHFLPPTVVI